MQNLLRVLRDELHVQGLTIIEGMRGIELGGPVQARLSAMSSGVALIPR